MKRMRAEVQWTCRDALNTYKEDENEWIEEREKKKEKETDTYVDEQIRLGS